MVLVAIKCMSIPSLGIARFVCEAVRIVYHISACQATLFITKVCIVCRLQKYYNNDEIYLAPAPLLLCSALSYNADAGQGNSISVWLI